MLPNGHAVTAVKTKKKRVTPWQRRHLFVVVVVIQRETVASGEEKTREGREKVNDIAENEKKKKDAFSFCDYSTGVLSDSFCVRREKI